MELHDNDILIAKGIPIASQKLTKTQDSNKTQKSKDFSFSFVCE